MAPQNSEVKWSPWILGNVWSDLGWLVLPGLIAFIISQFVREVSVSSIYIIYYFLNSNFTGSGHIYATFWRTFFYPTEMSRSRVYFWTPILCFLLYFCITYFSIPILVSIMAYSQLFHHIRQSYGVNKWYQRQNGVFRKGSDFFMYFLCGIPFLTMHFRSDVIYDGFFFPHDIFMYPNVSIHQALIGIYFVGLAAWIVYESLLILRGQREWNRLIALATAGFLNGMCFHLGRNEVEMMFPLVAYHGVTYFGIMSKSMERTQPGRYTMKRAVTLVLLTALILGLYEKYIQPPNWSEHLFLYSVWVGIYVTPILCHYVFDAILWKGNHPESRLVYGPARPLR